MTVITVIDLRKAEKVIRVSYAIAKVGLLGIAIASGASALASASIPAYGVKGLGILAEKAVHAVIFR